MSVYIPGMEMPKRCGECRMGFCKQIGCEMYIGFDDYAERRHPDCPLVHVPPRGRLGDLDALKEKLNALSSDHMHGYTSSTWDYICKQRSIIDNAPTIIPAEEGEV